MTIATQLVASRVVSKGVSADTLLLNQLQLEAFNQEII